MNTRRWILLVLASVGVSLALHYFRVVEYPYAERRLLMHRQMISHQAPSQLRHRVLAPFAAETLARSIALTRSGSLRWNPEDPGTMKPVLGAYLVLDAVSFAGALVAIFLLLEIWYPLPWAFSGALLAAASMPLSFGDHYYHPDSLVEMALFAASLPLIVRRRHGLLAFVFVLAALNRETSIFLGLAILAAWWSDRASRLVALGYLCVWATVFFGLRLRLGFPPPTFTLQMAWQGNRENWRQALALNATFLGGFWICVLLGIRRAPRPIVLASMMIPGYLALLVVIGYWWEIRYWLTLLPLLIPLGLATLIEPSSHASVAAPARPA